MRTPLKARELKWIKVVGLGHKKTVGMEVKIEKIYIQNDPQPQSSGCDESNEVWGHLFLLLFPQKYLEIFLRNVLLSNSLRK